MNPLALLFLFLFAIVIIASYMVIRRGLLRTRGVVVISFPASILLMVLFGFAQGNDWPQAITVGVLMGAIFSALSIGISSFFAGSEASQEAPDAPEDNPDAA